jgi:hypothetical protein
MVADGHALESRTGEIRHEIRRERVSRGLAAAASEQQATGDDE